MLHLLCCVPVPVLFGDPSYSTPRWVFFCWRADSAHLVSAVKGALQVPNISAARAVQRVAAAGIGQLPVALRQPGGRPLPAPLAPNANAHAFVIIVLDDLLQAQLPSLNVIHSLEGMKPMSWPITTGFGSAR